MKCAAFLAVVLIVVPGGLAAKQQQTQVFVLGSIGALHEKSEAFRYETLDRVIKAIRPDVMLLEVTPDELAAKLDTKGRPEYPNVVWPILRTPGAPSAVAMEAAQPLYAQLTGEGARIMSDFAKQRPIAHAALSAYTTAVTDALLQHWQTVADTQDEVTDLHALTRNRLAASLLPAGDALQVRWDRGMMAAVRQTIAENPGKRVLVLGTHRNRFMFVDTLRPLSGTTLVDMNRWLLANGFGRKSAP
jgi:hypothetical protein